MPIVDLDVLIQSAQSGLLVSFPTDTVPALAIAPLQAEKIFIAKQRQPNKPLILMAAVAEDLWTYTLGSPEVRQIWEQMAQSYWPGPLTLVLPAIPDLPLAINPLKTGTVGIRVPNHGIAQHILTQTGPLATTSANHSGSAPLETMAEIAAQFPEAITLRPSDSHQTKERTSNPISSNPNMPSAGIPSTVVRWAHNHWEILRQGAVQLDPQMLDT